MSWKRVQVKSHFISLFFMHSFWFDKKISIFKLLLFLVRWHPRMCIHLVIVCSVYKGVLPPIEWSILSFPLKSSLSPRFLRFVCSSTHVTWFLLNMPSITFLKKNKNALHALLYNSHYAYSRLNSIWELQDVILTLSMKFPWPPPQTFWASPIPF